MSICLIMVLKNKNNLKQDFLSKFFENFEKEKMLLKKDFDLLNKFVNEKLNSIKL